MHLVTDLRWIMVAGNRDGDQRQELILYDIKATNYETGDSFTSKLSKNVFALETDGAHYAVPLSNDYDESDLEELSLYLRDNYGASRGGVAVDSDEAGYTIAGNDAIKYDASDVRTRIDRLPDSALDEADELIAQTDDLEELIPRLDELIEENEKSNRSLNDRVSEASSVEELRRGIETPAERAQRHAKERAERGLEQARETFNQADPEEVGKWGVNVGRSAAPLAKVAPGSTPLWIAAYLMLGGVAGTHASGAKNSPLADVDPEALAAHATALADAGKGLENIDGEAAGALLGAFSYLGHQLTPDEYAKWIVAANPEAILAGAEAGASFAVSDDVSGTRRQGAVAGAGLGILGSYANIDDNSDALQAIVDADLYEEYLEELSDSRERTLEESTV
ncbi:hypothetical protein [Natronorubrum daqingense]|nr:hypothetical protein [Natronorubrum daqingense]APX96809.1 hypothetical protein BB347_09355 [Natronorubrum daqingense]